MNHIQVKLGLRKRNNLRKLASYLLNKNWNDENSSKFNMACFLVDAGGDRKNELTYDCNTIGCSLGHGPAAGIPFPKFGDINYGWRSYAEDNFVDRASWEYPLYNWLFALEWKNVDNTPQGAAKRILYFLEHGVPENYREQMTRPIELGRL